MQVIVILIPQEKIHFLIIIIQKFYTLLIIWMKPSETCLVMVTIIENYNRPLFKPQQQLYSAGSSHLRGVEAPVRSEPSYNLVITITSTKDI